MLSHLLQKHQLMDPKKYEAAARGIENALKRQKNEGGRWASKEELSPKSLKKAIAYFIADADLCFSIVHHLYGAHSEYLKKFFKSLKHVAFTLDAWTSPNTKAFMGNHRPCYQLDMAMIDVVVAMPVVHGAHTGFNFAETFLEVLERYELSNSIVSITAETQATTRPWPPAGGRNHPGSNGSQHFHHQTRWHRDQSEDRHHSNTWTYNHVRLTPQRRAQFVSFLPEAESPSQTSDTPSNEPKKNPKEEEDSRMLIPDVKTRWNSTYLMLKRALELRVACDKFCRGSEARKYSLNPVEWRKLLRCRSS
ncbi:hypothetical protein H4Q26_001044 [Puccinia striiformis f. sp. tritici PST-130]|nr:hypothetical protein H4Q26_001044 [Puccinia striiformis f. sp. tritici PST-130]